MSENGRLAPSELAPIAQGQLRKDAAAGFNAMNIEARRLGVELYPTGSMSSYRTYAQQVILWDRYRAGTGNLAARPGSSNHGWALAVDFATHEMRSMVDRIGAKYGWSKQWSDAPSEWWHVLFQPGHYKGPDPGPHGAQPTPAPPKDVADIVVVMNRDGRLEAFVEIETVGVVLHAWQEQPNGRWTDWHSLGIPGN